MTQLEIMGANAKKASRFLMNAGAKKNDALLAIAKALTENTSYITENNIWSLPFSSVEEEVLLSLAMLENSS